MREVFCPGNPTFHVSRCKPKYANQPELYNSTEPSQGLPVSD